MKCGAKNLFCFFSLLVFVGSVTLWVRDYSKGVAVQWNSRPVVVTTQPVVRRYFGYRVLSARGVVAICGYELEGGNITNAMPRWQFNSLPPTFTLIVSKSTHDRLHLALGEFQLFHNVTTLRSGKADSKVLTVPLWLFLPAAIPPFLWWRNRRKIRTQGFPVALTSSTEP